MNKLIYKDIETKRLILRYPKKSDYSYQFEFLSDKSNFPYADFKIIKNINELDQFFQNKFKGFLETSLFWMICDRKTDIPVGTVSAWNIDYGQNSIEFGFSLYPEHHGKGFMIEVLEELIEYCHTTLKFTLFDIWTHKDNIPSIRLARRLGFKFMGYVVESAQNSDGNIEYATYQLVKI
ncbi:MAG: GNAT family N-acetyltransferase [Tenericutes bacterium]|nr:GNAT family N-acetyltransferase [Mycoplasmatota bacterium]